jgi:predicted aconitase with swiveling domain
VTASWTSALAARSVLYPGTGEGPLLRLSAPLSFWGGVDPRTSEIILASHPERGRLLKGSVLALAEPIGSSSSSYVMLELIHNRLAPAAVLLGAPDAILIVGCLVARELGYTAPPVLDIEPAALNRLRGSYARVHDGAVDIR